MRGNHPAAQVIGVAQPAQRARLVGRGTGVAGKASRVFVLGQTAVDIAEGKIEIAAQEMNAREEPGIAVLAGRRLCLLKNLQRILETVGNAQSPGQTDPRVAPPFVVAGHRERRFECFGRRRNLAEIMQDLAHENRQCVFVVRGL